jgi:phenylalanyl-tRNA synthetase beta chain
MRVPISWLEDFVDIELSPEQLAELLTNAGLEVSTIERLGIAEAELEWERDKVVLAQIISVEQHPNADRLVLAQVEYGTRGSRAIAKRVVTGAPNLFEYLGVGDLRQRRLFSPMLLEGGSYLDPYKDGRKTRLSGKELRGIFNDAMLCSPIELGLGEDHDGILILEDSADQTYVAGTPLVDLLGDAVLDIDIIPNIARCASILGVAREVAALTGTTWREPDWSVTMEGAPIAGRVEVEAHDPELNPRFVALLIEGVEQRPSPFWMQHRLRLAGQRPINVVVDISNYVMLEMGQPNHTFDYEFLRRRADRYAKDGPVRLYPADRSERRGALDAAGAEVVTLDRVDPPAVLADLHRRGLRSVLVEGGGEVTAAFVAAGTFDRVSVDCAPVLLGGERAPGPVRGAGIARLDLAPRLERLRARRRGPDLILTGTRDGCLQDLLRSVGAS